MAVKKWYLSSTPSSFTASYDVNWDSIGASPPGTSQLTDAPSGDASSASVTETSTSNTFDGLPHRWVSEPIRQAGTISADGGGTGVTATVAAEGPGSAGNLFSLMFLRVVTPDGELRARPAAGGYTVAVWDGLLARTYNLSGTSFTATPVFPGDRVVFEFGFRANNTATTPYTGTLRYGGTGTDLAPGDTGADAARPAHVTLVGGNSSQLWDVDLTDVTNQTYTASGLTGTYHRYAAHINTSLPVGLMVHFHGDGAYEFDNPTDPYSIGGPKGVLAEARRRNMVLVVARTPDTTGTATWWEDGSANADYANNLIRAMHGAYGATSLWLNGYSGGAQFITEYLLPKHPTLIEHSGGAIMFGGGGTPEVTEGTYPSGAIPGWRMRWVTGEQDIAANSSESYDGLDEAQLGYNHYRALGFPVSNDYPVGVGHDMDNLFGPYTADWLNRVLDPADYAGKTFRPVHTFDTATEYTTGTWVRDTTVAHTGPASLRSPAVANNGTADAVFPTPSGAVSVRFRYRTASELDGDFLRVLIGAEDQPVASGPSPYGWKLSPAYDVRGQTSVTFRYAKDANTTAGSDQVWIDSVEFETTPTVTPLAVNLSPNPAAGLSLYEWNGQPYSSSTLARVTGLSGFSRTTGAQVTSAGYTQTPTVEVEPGVTYLFQCEVRSPSTATVTVWVDWFSTAAAPSNTSLISAVSQSETFTADTVQTVSFIATAPADARGADFAFNSMPAGTVYTAVLVTPSTVAAPYGDGDTPGWEWSGSRYESTSAQVEQPATEAPAGTATGSGGALTPSVSAVPTVVAAPAAATSTTTLPSPSFAVAFPAVAASSAGTAPAPVPQAASTVPATSGAGSAPAASVSTERPGEAVIAKASGGVPVVGGTYPGDIYPGDGTFPGGGGSIPVAVRANAVPATATAQTGASTPQVTVETTAAVAAGSATDGGTTRIVSPQHASAAGSAEGSSAVTAQAGAASAAGAAFGAVAAAGVFALPDPAAASATAEAPSTAVDSPTAPTPGAAGAVPDGTFQVAARPEPGSGVGDSSPATVSTTVTPATVEIRGSAPAPEAQVSTRPPLASGVGVVLEVRAGVPGAGTPAVITASGSVPAPRHTVAAAPDTALASGEVAPPQGSTSLTRTPAAAVAAGAVEAPSVGVNVTPETTSGAGDVPAPTLGLGGSVAAVPATGSGAANPVSARGEVAPAAASAVVDVDASAVAGAAGSAATGAASADPATVTVETTPAPAALAGAVADPVGLVSVTAGDTTAGATCFAASVLVTASSSTATATGQSDTATAASTLPIMAATAVGAAPTAHAEVTPAPTAATSTGAAVSAVAGSSLTRTPTTATATGGSTGPRPVVTARTATATSTVDVFPPAVPGYTSPPTMLVTADVESPTIAVTPAGAAAGVGAGDSPTPTGVVAALPEPADSAGTAGPATVQARFVAVPAAGSASADAHGLVGATSAVANAAGQALAASSAVAAHTPSATGLSVSDPAEVTVTVTPAPATVTGVAPPPPQVARVQVQHTSGDGTAIPPAARATARPAAAAASGGAQDVMVGGERRPRVALGHGTAVPATAGTAATPATATGAASAGTAGPAGSARPAQAGAVGAAMTPRIVIDIRAGTAAANAAAAAAGKATARPGTAHGAGAAHAAQVSGASRVAAATSMGVAGVPRARVAARPVAAVCTAVTGPPAPAVTFRTGTAAGTVEVFNARGPSSWVLPWQVLATRVDDTTAAGLTARRVEDTTTEPESVAAH